MSNVSDDRLKQIFRKKLKNYEPLPPEESWKRIHSELMRAKRGTSAVVWGSVVILFVLTSVVFRDTTPAANYLSISEQLKMSSTELACQRSFGFAQLDSTQVLNTLLCNQAIIQSESIQKSESDRISSTQSSKQHEAFIAKSVTPDLIIDASPKIVSRLDFRISKNSLIYIKQLELPQLDEISLVRLDSLSRSQNERSKDEAVKSTRQKRDQRQLAGYPVLRITTFYNSGVFTPLLADAVRVDRFSQSKRLFTNRLGFMLEMGYRKKLDELDLEYFAGYKVFSKELEYTTTVVEERTIAQTTHRISGLTHILRAGVAIRPSFQPMVFSIAYEKAFGSFTAHMGNQMINLGLGAEKKINSRISLRPGISYGISVDGAIRHFNYKPIGWNLELIWKPKVEQ